MLIKDKMEHDELRVARKRSCAWCESDLDYPRIVLSNATATSFHVDCAVQMAASINHDVYDLLNSRELPGMASRMLVTNLAHRHKILRRQDEPETEELSAMAQVFHEARQQP